MFLQLIYIKQSHTYTVLFKIKRKIAAAPQKRFLLTFLNGLHRIRAALQ